MGDDLAPAGGPRWVTLEGGSFIAGSDDFYPDEAPARERTVAAFQLATTPVTNRQFATFVEATGHLTVAERPLSEAEFPHLPAAERAPGSLVFTPTAGPVDLGDWRAPSGPSPPTATACSTPSATSGSGRATSTTGSPTRAAVPVGRTSPRCALRPRSRRRRRPRPGGW